MPVDSCVQYACVSLCLPLNMYAPVCTYLCCVCSYVRVDVDGDILMPVCT